MNPDKDKPKVPPKGPSKSQQIRDLFDKGEHNTSAIAKQVGVRYQFAYQVIAKHREAKELHELRKRAKVADPQASRVA